MRCVALLALLTAAIPVLAQEDLRARFGTRGLPAAQHIERGLTLLETKQPLAALAAFDAALHEESDCAFAHFQRAMALGDLGRIDEAIAAYEQAYALRGPRLTNVPIEAAINLGLMYAHLDDVARSNLWLTRAILADPRAELGLLGKAYRNLAVNALNQKEPLSAAIAAALGRRTSPGQVEEALVMTAAERITARDEVARVLTIELPDCGVPAREAPAGLTPVDLAGDVPTAEVHELRPHAERPLVCAFTRGESTYHLVEAGAVPGCRQRTTPGPVLAADVVADDLYLVLDAPPRLVKLDPADGTLTGEYALPAPAPSSVAVLPARNEVYLGGEPYLHVLNLETGRVEETDCPGVRVRADPHRNLLYSFSRPRGRDRTIELLIGGQPIFLQPTDPDWRQTTLFQYVPTDAGLRLAWLRISAAANGSTLLLSPDGRWVAVVGGGGWRPAGGTRGGYGVAVLCAADPTHVQGFFNTMRPLTTQRGSTGAVQPLGFAFNGVTHQVVAVTGERAMVYHLGNEQASVEIPGEYAGACAWTADGAWLVLALKKGGLALYANELTEAERARAAAIATSRPDSASLATRMAEAVSELVNFTPGSESEDARALLQTAMQRGRTERPPPWRDCAVYAPDSTVVGRILATVPEKETGIRIYRLRQALEQQPTSLPLRCTLADYLRQSGQLDDAAGHAIAVVHEDAGRTDLAILALHTLAEIHAARGDEIGEIHCLSAALLADRFNPTTRARLLPLVAARKWAAEGATLEQLPVSDGAAFNLRSLVLVAPPADAATRSAAEIFTCAAPAVVRVQTDENAGSGFCIATPGLVLTSAHVVGRQERVTVQVFVLRDGRIEQRVTVPARVVFRSDAEDVAVLRLTNPPESLVPLPIALRDPGVGQRVYALGHPVAGDNVMEQTLTEGLINAVDRQLGENVYLQHSAATHAGSSGGPLLDDRGVVVGLVTLKADLREVGFALPAQRLRAVLPGSRE